MSFYESLILKSLICTWNSYKFIHRSKYRDGIAVCHCYNYEYSSCENYWHFVMRKWFVTVHGAACIKVQITAHIRFGVQTILLIGLGPFMSMVMFKAVKCIHAIIQNTRPELPPRGCFVAQFRNQKKRVSLLPRKRRSGAPPFLPVAGITLTSSFAAPSPRLITVLVVPALMVWPFGMDSSG